MEASGTLRGGTNPGNCDEPSFPGIKGREAYIKFSEDYRITEDERLEGISKSIKFRKLLRKY